MAPFHHGQAAVPLPTVGEMTQPQGKAEEASQPKNIRHNYYQATQERKKNHPNNQRHTLPLPARDMQDGVPEPATAGTGGAADASPIVAVLAVLAVLLHIVMYVSLAWPFLAFAALLDEPHYCFYGFLFM